MFVPWELYQCMGFDLLRPLAKLQALQNMNLYHAIRMLYNFNSFYGLTFLNLIFLAFVFLPGNELRRRGKNGGLKMLNIACEIAVPVRFT